MTLLEIGYRLFALAVIVVTPVTLIKEKRQFFSGTIPVRSWNAFTRFISGAERKVERMKKHE